MDVAKIPHIVSWLHSEGCENGAIVDGIRRSERTRCMSHPYEIEPRQLLKDAEERQRRMLEQLRELVSIESPSEDKAAVDRAGGLIAGWFEELGAKIRCTGRKNLVICWKCDSARWLGARVAEKNLF